MTMIESGAEPRFDANALPVFAPDPALRVRILAAHARQRRQRRVRVLCGGALAASFALAALLLARRELALPVASRVETVSTAQDESRGLELEWQRAAASRSAQVAAPRVRAIDAQLQSAYDRGADARELSTLWAQRNAALRQLIQASGEGIVAADDYGATRI